jgi:hypothetical protein
MSKKMKEKIKKIGLFKTKSFEMISNYIIKY